VIDTGELDHRVQRGADAENGGRLDHPDGARRAPLEVPANQLCVRLRYGQRAVLVLPVALLRQLAEDGADIQRVTSGMPPEPAGRLDCHRHAQCGSERRDVRRLERAQGQRLVRDLAPALGKLGLSAPAHREDDQRATRQQPPGGEQQRAQRFRVHQLRVISDDDAGRVVRCRADQLQQLKADRDVLSGEERIAANAARAEQLVGRGERDVEFAFITARAQHPACRQLGEEALDQRGLPDAGLALEQEDLQAPTRRLGERIVERAQLHLAVDEDGCCGGIHHGHSYQPRPCPRSRRRTAAATPGRGHGVVVNSAVAVTNRTAPRRTRPRAPDRRARCNATISSPPPHQQTTPDQSHSR
jgi:hypothetical protein